MSARSTCGRRQRRDLAEPRGSSGRGRLARGQVITEWRPGVLPGRAPGHPLEGPPTLGQSGAGTRSRAEAARRGTRGRLLSGGGEGNAWRCTTCPQERKAPVGASGRLRRRRFCPCADSSPSCQRPSRHGSQGFLMLSCPHPPGGTQGQTRSQAGATGGERRGPRGTAQAAGRGKARRAGSPEGRPRRGKRPRRRPLSPGLSGAAPNGGCRRVGGSGPLAPPAGKSQESGCAQASGWAPEPLAWGQLPRRRPVIVAD